jgi:HNH endonuclease
MTMLPPTLGGAPTQPLEVGRTSRVVTAAQRVALVVRDRGCGFPGCDRPPAWCEAHHLVHWLHGGPTDLANLALVCRAHHRRCTRAAGGWRLQRDPDGRLTATPPQRRHTVPPPDPATPPTAACRALGGDLAATPGQAAS